MIFEHATIYICCLGGVVVPKWALGSFFFPSLWKEGVSDWVSRNICSAIKILFPSGRGGKRQSSRLALGGSTGRPWLAFEFVPGKGDSLHVWAGADEWGGVIFSGWNIRLKPRQPPRRTCSEKLSRNINIWWAWHPWIDLNEQTQSMVEFQLWVDQMVHWYHGPATSFGGGKSFHSFTSSSRLYTFSYYMLVNILFHPITIYLFKHNEFTFSCMSSYFHVALGACMAPLEQMGQHSATHHPQVLSLFRM